MPNTIDSNGLTITTLQEVIDNFTASLQAIYGSDINLDQNSPDGQMLNIWAQTTQDLTEYLARIYNDFDPDQAEGINLDSRCAINNIQRKSGSYTTVDVDITVDRSINLKGIDDGSDMTGLFTISDANNNQFYLTTSQSFGGAGTYTRAFRAVNMGNIYITQNTLTTLVTILLGVISVNNPDPITLLGTNEETDVELRDRRKRSTAINSLGFLETMVSALLNLDGMLDVSVLENNTSSTDGRGIPAHSYWIICKGTATQEAIGEVIYNKRSGGTGMLGDIDVDITQIDGSIFIVSYDDAVAEDLYISFKIVDLIGDGSVDFDFIKQEIVNNIFYKIGQIANKTTIESFVNSLYPNAYVKECQVSNDGMIYVDTLSITDYKNYFALDISRIDISYV